MSASSLTGDSLTQMLSFSSMAAVVAGVPPEVALGSLAGAVISLPPQLSTLSGAEFCYRF